MNLLGVKNICKTYGSGETEVKDLKDVGFSVPKGEYMAIGRAQDVRGTSALRRPKWKGEGERE